MQLDAISLENANQSFIVLILCRKSNKDIFLKGIFRDLIWTTATTVLKQQHENKETKVHLGVSSVCLRHLESLDQSDTGDRWTGLPNVLPMFCINVLSSHRGPPAATRAATYQHLGRSLGWPQLWHSLQSWGGGKGLLTAFCVGGRRQNITWSVSKATWQTAESN